MASDAPSWADQWGAGGIGSLAEEEEHDTANKRDKSSNKKGDGKTGLNKAKSAAVSGAQKIKSGASNSFKWVKDKVQKKDSSK